MFVLHPPCRETDYNVTSLLHCTSGDLDFASHYWNSSLKAMKGKLLLFKESIVLQNKNG